MLFLIELVILANIQCSILHFIRCRVGFFAIFVLFYRRIRNLYILAFILFHNSVILFSKFRNFYACSLPLLRIKRIIQYSCLIFNKYKTFSVLIYSYINTSGNWENEKLCGNTTPEGRSVFTQFRVFPISTSVDITVYQYGKNVLYLFYNIAQRNIKKEIFRRFRVDIELYQHGS